MKSEYIVIRSKVVGGMEREFDIVYSSDGERFGDRQEAIVHGLHIHGTDDFNIGVLQHGKLVSLDWMEKPIDTDPDFLQSITGQIALRASA